MLKNKLIVGARIRLGKNYCKGRHGINPGEIITLVEGDFECDNGLYCETQTAPAIWNESMGEYDSIFHLFGNDLDEFEDCTVINDDRPSE